MSAIPQKVSRTLNPHTTTTISHLKKNKNEIKKLGDGGLLS
jgi:hypothetical protein